ncbi:MAG: helix-turn-helix transcriptional regulator [Myxococcota bacterium]
MQPLDRRLFASSLVRVGAFCVRPDDPRFSDTGPIHAHIFVFPRRSVRITHEGQPPITADANVVMYYNKAQRYRRDAISVDGDRCEWFNVSESTLVDAIEAYDPAVRDRPGQPYPFAWGPCPSDVYLAQRDLTQRLSAPTYDGMVVEEAVFALLERIVQSVYRGRPCRASRRGDRRRTELAEAARSLVGRRFFQPLSLPQVAESLKTSPYHLSRVFRTHVGTTLHRYINQLRLRIALERLTEPNIELTELALELGFASHSHFTERFRKTFGRTPSVVRAQLKGRPRIRAKIRQRPADSS